MTAKLPAIPNLPIIASVTVHQTAPAGGGRLDGGHTGGGRSAGVKWGGGAGKVSGCDIGGRASVLGHSAQFDGRRHAGSQLTWE